MAWLKHHGIVASQIKIGRRAFYFAPDSKALQ
jgi:hypothetical protein